MSSKSSATCPEYKDRAPLVNVKGAGASSACGGHIEERGEVRVNCEIDGDVHKIPYRDMDVSMPIASMQRIIKDGHNQLVISPTEGYIENL